MELRQRLTLLRSQSGAPPCPAAPPPPAGPVSVAERMQRLRGVPHPDSHSSRDVQTAALLGGEVLAAGLIVVEQRFALTHQHGQRYLTSITGLQQPLPLLDQALPAEHMVFLDTETTGLAGGTGTVAFLLGVGRIAGDTLSVRQFFLTGFRGEAAMLQAVATWVSDSSYLVTFNGKSFDLPLLTTRYRLARLADPFRDIQHIDLFHPTRRAFQRQWPDCRLQTAEQRLLGFRRQHDLPAHLVPEAWFAFVRRGTTTKLPALLEHNRWDLVSLVALLPTLTEAFHRPAEHGADVTAIARYWRMRGDEQRALTYLQAHEWHLDVTGLLDLAALYKRQRCWSAAVAIWHRLEAQRSVAALEELAKYYEHV
ncbi:MAG: hypothetical protein FJZ47_15565, partial [Candidatus Tectomicrobia bacterium]|nr:hypothetical protein [Candidatus Tectomicrobia bacterium]